MPKCEIYKDMKGKWRWRRTNKNGDIETTPVRRLKPAKNVRSTGKKKERARVINEFSYVRGFREWAE